MKFTTLILTGILTWTTTAAAYAAMVDVPYSTSLKADAALAKSRGVPVLVMFSAPHCSYCERLLNEFLLPMQRNPEYAAKVLMRRVEVGGTQNLVDFNGKTTTQGDFAARHRIAVAPTVVVFDYQGKMTADPLVGLGPVDYYGGYLDAAIDTGLMKVLNKKQAQRLN